MTLFGAFVFTHFVMDWIFQTNWQATHKHLHTGALYRHCLIYTCGFLLVFFAFHVPLIWLFVIFISHITLDAWSFPAFVLREIKHTKKEDVPEYLWAILNLVIDQIAHVGILVLIASTR